MRRREFLQKSHKYKGQQTPPNGRYLSFKLDGQRAFWDGGITRGLPAATVPWANTAKDERLTRAVDATGLWSSYGKAIQAPDWWLDRLPPLPLDGELWCGPGTFQQTSSTVSRLIPTEDWRLVEFHVWDSPNLARFLTPGIINNPFQKLIVSTDMLDWAVDQSSRVANFHQTEFDLFYEQVYDRLHHWEIENNIVRVVTQNKIPRQSEVAHEFVETALKQALDLGMEGVMIHHHFCQWLPQRTTDILKYKPFNDAEGLVVGYKWGRETDKGSKLLGLMGAMIVDFGGIRFDLSGFDNEERTMVDVQGSTSMAYNEGRKCAGEVVSEFFYNPYFPRGTTVSFRYREFSLDGVPKEARYLRKRSSIG
jgi:DNA ligase-1